MSAECWPIAAARSRAMLPAEGVPAAARSDASVILYTGPRSYYDETDLGVPPAAGVPVGSGR